MRVLSLAQLLLISLFVAGCATIFEGRYTDGRIFVKGNNKGREVYFLKEPAQRILSLWKVQRMLQK